MSNRITLNAPAIFRVLATTAGLLILAGVAGQLSKFLLGHGSVKGLVALFDLSREQNLPTFFTVVLMLFAALLLAVIAILNRMQKIPDAPKWSILACGFLFMAYDEAFQIHEMLGAPVKTLMGQITHGIFYFAWVIPGIAIVFCVAMFFLRFLLRLPKTTRRIFFLAAALYICGSIGFELFGGAYAEVHGLNNLTYNLISTAEESLEMAGLVVFIYALLLYLTQTREVLILQLKGPHVS